MVPGEQFLAPLHDARALLNLTKQEGSEEIRHSERGTLLDPRVTVHSAVEECSPVRALVVQHVSPGHVPLFINDKCSALPARKVLRFVKTQGREPTE